MKSKRLLSLMLLCFAVFGVARAQVTIGDLQNATDDSYLPMNSLYDYSYTQQIYTADEIGMAGTINSITVWMYGNANLYDMPFDIYMVEVDKEAFESATDWVAVTTADIVYSGSVEVHNTEAEAYTFTLDTPFAYSGQGNLLIAFDNNTGNWKSGLRGKVFSNEGDTDNRAIYARQDNTDYDPTNMAGISAYGITVKRNVIELDITSSGGPTCARPTGLTVNYQGGSTATATWSGEASLYNIEVNGIVTPGVTSPHIFDVEPATNYTVRVQADCGDGLTSGWTGGQSFFTPCEAFDIPYTYGFEDANELNCWNVLYTANTPGIVTSPVYEGSNSFRFSSYSSASSYDQYLISPQLNAPNGVGVAFYYRTYGYAETFKVGYSTTTNDPSAFTWGDEISTSTTEWQMFEENYPAGTKFVGIYYYSSYQYYLYVDDFNFDAPSSCRKPTDFAVSEIASRSAKLSWTENGEARSWNLLVNGELIEGVDNPHTMTGLTPETSYTVQVSPVCEVDKWSDEITFTTLVACPAPVVSIDEVTPISATMSWEGTGNYEMEYMIDPVYRFENGLDGWTNITVIDTGGMWLHSDNNPGEYDYTTHAHSGTGYAMCYSFIDYDGAYNTDAYLVSPQSYQIINEGASLNFWYDMANDSYPEAFDVCVATAANPTAADFTAIWSSGAKGFKNDKANMRQRNTRYDNWREVTLDLSAYVGQTIWIAFHDVNYDGYEVWIDDVFVNNGTMEWTPAPAPIASPYTLTPLDPETSYMVRVRANCGNEDGYSVWTTVNFTTLSNCETPFNLNVTNLMPTTATLNWTGYQDGFEARYRIPGSQEVFFFEDFEGTTDNELPEGWTTIDNDGDENVWYTINQESFAQYSHSGQGIATSASYNGSALTPDNWLVTPQIALQGTMKVYLRAQDPNYAEEGYAIYLSTTGNTVDDFTVELYPESFDLTGEYKEITADLSSYNGQMGYIAIRHFDCEDMFRINVDDFGIYGGEIAAGEWTYVTSGDLFADIEDLDPETTYEWQVRGENRSCTNGEEAGYTPWSEMSTFTTPGLCDDPNSFIFENFEATTATLTWTGYQESYNVWYRTAEIGYEFWDDFSDGFVNWTGDNLSEDNIVTEVTSNGIMGYVMFWDDELGAQTMISNELEPTPSGASLSFYAATGGVSTYKVGYSSTDNALTSFTWSDVITCEDDNYFHEFSDENVPEGTKYIAVQFVSNVPSEDGYSYLIVTYFDLYAVSVEAGEWVQLTVNEPSVTMEPLDPETEYEVYVQGICGEGEDDVTNWVGGSFMTPELTTITQPIALAGGKNWVSFYVETNMNDLKAALVEALPGATSITIASQRNGQTFYNGTRWRGALSTLDIAQMYLITAPESCEIELVGMPVDPAAHPITIKPGPNWIGFPFSTNMTPTVAFAELAVSGDKLNSQTQQANYSNRWRGALNTLEPGKGYIYNSARTEDKVFTYPVSASKGAQAIGLTTGNKSMKHQALNMPASLKATKASQKVDQSTAKNK